jgi:flagellar hook-associated protein 2
MSLISFGGLASGIDTASLIDALIEKQRINRIDPVKKRIEEYTQQNDALSDLTKKLESLSSVLQKFRAVNGGGISKLATSSSESRVTAAASNAASNGTYTVTVSQLASNAAFSFDDRFSSATATINSSINNGASAASRTVTVGIGTGTNTETVHVELTNSSTISDFVNSFNASSSKAEASIINVGTASSPSYAISIHSLNQGTELGELSISVGAEITSAGSGAFAAYTLSQATNATFSISGISGSLTRGSNTVNDVIAGLTLSLQSTGSATVSIRDDAATTTSSLQEFVDAFNDVLSFVAKNDRVVPDDEAAKTVFGPLSSTSLDESIVSMLRQALSSASGGSASVGVFADLGITTQRDGTLRLDTDRLAEAIAADSEGVRTLTTNFADAVAGVSGSIAQYTRFNGLIDMTERANSDQISALNNRVDDLEKALEKQRQSLESQYARLESLIGRMNSQRSALGGLITG